MIILDEYREIKTQIQHLPELGKENRLREAQFILLSKRIDSVRKKIDGLKDIDHKLKAIVNLETEEDSHPYRGVGGSDPVSAAPAGKTAGSNESKDTYKQSMNAFLDEQKGPIDAEPSIWPAKGWVISQFGYRTTPDKGLREFNRGIDISSSGNTHIVAPADGIVSKYQWRKGYGRELTLHHGYGIVTKYAYLEKALVNEGEHVERGDVIAVIGNSGPKKFFQLHYEVHLNGIPVNPFLYIPD